jgi:hypothetical protein
MTAILPTERFSVNGVPLPLKDHPMRPQAEAVRSALALIAELYAAQVLDGRIELSNSMPGAHDCLMLSASIDNDRDLDFQPYLSTVEMHSAGIWEAIRDEDLDAAFVAKVGPLIEQVATLAKIAWPLNDITPSRKINYHTRWSEISNHERLELIFRSKA